MRNAATAAGTALLRALCLEDLRDARDLVAAVHEDRGENGGLAIGLDLDAGARRDGQPHVAAVERRSIEVREPTTPKGASLDTRQA